MSISPDFSKINVKHELAAIVNHISSRWNVGSDFSEMINDMYQTVQRYGKYWYDWRRIGEWNSELLEQRQSTLAQKWGEHHASGLVYLDMPLIHTEVLLSQTRNIERVLDKHNLEAYHHHYVSKERYKTLKEKYPWLKESTPIHMNAPGMGYESRVKDVPHDENEFQGHEFRYATRPGLVQAIDVGYIRKYSASTAHEELCTAIMIHLESVHRHNQAIDVIQALHNMGVNNNDSYPVFESNYHTENPLAKSIQDIVQARRSFVLHNLHKPEVQSIIANFLTDPQNCKSIFETLLPHMEIRRPESYDMSDLIQSLDDITNQQHLDQEFRK